MIRRQPRAVAAAAPDPFAGRAIKPPERRPFGMGRAIPLMFAVVIFAVTTAASAFVYAQHQRNGLFSVSPGVAIAILCLTWPSRPVWQRRDRAQIAVVAVLLLAGYVAISARCGGDPRAALRAGGVFVPLAVAFLALYRRSCPGTEWFPTTHRQGRAFLGWSATYAFLVVLAGGLPGSGISGSDDVLKGAWWACLAYGRVLEASIVTFALLQPVRQFSRVQLRETIPAGVLVGAACLVLPALYPRYPLEWMLLIPALWIGVTLPLRAAVAAAMSIPIGLGAITSFAHPGQLYGPTVDNALQSLLYVVCVALVTAIAAEREGLARLFDQVADAAHEEAAHSALVDAVIGSMSDSVVLTGRSGDVVMANPASRAMLGTLSGPADDGVPWVRAAGVARRDGTSLSEPEVQRLLAPDPDDTVRVTVRSTDPQAGERFYTISARALPGQEEAMTLVVLADSTAEHRRHRELEAFAGDVAHDLKGPLSAIAIWMDTAESDALDDIDAGRFALRRARLASKRMADTVDDCLAYTTTRSGLLHPRDVDLGDVVREVASVYEAGGAVVEVAAEASVRADATLLRRLVGNLIGNAVKYAKPGEPPWIRVSAAPDRGTGWLRITVADRGIGIDPSEAETIFAQFSRTAHGSATGDGTGLGLALCRSIVERHQGKISAYRNEWGGASFEFTLPQGRTLVR